MIPENSILSYKWIAVGYGGRGHIRGRLCTEFKGFEVVLQVLEIKRGNSSVSIRGTFVPSKIKLWLFAAGSLYMWGRLGLVSPLISAVSRSKTRSLSWSGLLVFWREACSRMVMLLFCVVVIILRDIAHMICPYILLFLNHSKRVIRATYERYRAKYYAWCQSLICLARGFEKKKLFEEVCVIETIQHKPRITKNLTQKESLFLV